MGDLLYIWRVEIPESKWKSFCLCLTLVPRSVFSDGRVEVTAGGSLQISNLTEEDGGVYTCVAENSNTTIEAQAQLTVQGNLISQHRWFLRSLDSDPQNNSGRNIGPRHLLINANKSVTQHH